MTKKGRQAQKDFSCRGKKWRQWEGVFDRGEKSGWKTVRVKKVLLLIRKKKKKKTIRKREFGEREKEGGQSCPLLFYNAKSCHGKDINRAEC